MFDYTNSTCDYNSSSSYSNNSSKNLILQSLIRNTWITYYQYYWSNYPPTFSIYYIPTTSLTCL